jgi:hypothetical protein
MGLRKILFFYKYYFRVISYQSFNLEFYEKNTT